MAEIPNLKSESTNSSLYDKLKVMISSIKINPAFPESSQKDMGVNIASTSADTPKSKDANNIINGIEKPIQDKLDRLEIKDSVKDMITRQNVVQADLRHSASLKELHNKESAPEVKDYSAAMKELKTLSDSEKKVVHGVKSNIAPDEKAYTKEAMTSGNTRVALEAFKKKDILQKPLNEQIRQISESKDGKDAMKSFASSLTESGNQSAVNSPRTVSPSSPGIAF